MPAFLASEPPCGQVWKGGRATLIELLVWSVGSASYFPEKISEIIELGIRNKVQKRKLPRCHNNSCRHGALIDVSKYPSDTLIVVQIQGEVREVWPQRPVDRR
jgi:hypothetical protein